MDIVIPLFFLLFFGIFIYVIFSMWRWYKSMPDDVECRQCHRRYKIDGTTEDRYPYCSEFCERRSTEILELARGPVSRVVAPSRDPSKGWAFLALCVALIVASIPDRSFLTMLIGAVIASALGVIGVSEKRRFERESQEVRDQESRDLFDDLKRGVRRPFYLYLRPFWITNAVPVKNPLYSSDVLWPDRYRETRKKDFESILASAMPNAIPIVALGIPGESIGAGRVQSAEEAWKSEFMLLATNASTVLVVPSERGGTKWEVEWLRSNARLPDCIFVMPPASLKSSDVKLADEWRRAAEHLPVKLPPYDSGGLLFTLDKEGNVDRGFPLPMNSPQALAAAMRKLRSEPNPELPLWKTLKGNIGPPRRMNPILKFALIMLGNYYRRNSG